MTTPRTKVRGFSGCFPAGKHAGFSPKAPSGPRKTLTPYRQASAMLLALPRVFVWSFTHRTTRWNPLLQVSRSTGNFVPKNIVPNPCPPVVDVGELSSLRSHVAARYAARYAARDRVTADPCIPGLVSLCHALAYLEGYLGNRGIIAPPHPHFSLSFFFFQSSISSIRLY